MNRPQFTTVNMSLCNKDLHIEIRLENESGGFVDCKPFDFRVPGFHRPCELDFRITSTAKDFRNIYSKGLLEIFLLLKLTKGEWKELINEYEGYFEPRRERSSPGSIPNSDLSPQYPVQHEPSSNSLFSQQEYESQLNDLCYSIKSNEKFYIGDVESTDRTKNKEMTLPEHSLQDKLSLDAFYHAAHPKESSPQLEICDKKLDEKLVEKFKNYIENAKKCCCHDKQEELCSQCYEYCEYVKKHLQNDNCPLKYCPLWKLCVKKQRYEFCKRNGPAGLVLFSQNADRIGTVQTDYYGFSKDIVLGGYKRVYKVVLQRGPMCEIAVKEEVTNAEMPKLNKKQFKLIRNLDHKNVIKIEECVLDKEFSGQRIGQHRDGETPYLFVMPFINRRGLNDQFPVYRSIVDYLCKIPKLGDKILLNYIHIMSDVYEGLKYFAKKNLVHGDIKRSNILVEQLCDCPTVIECKCSSKCFVAKLADFDFIRETRQDGTWAKPLPYIPGGTVGMQAPETYFQDKNGNLMSSPIADMWSASITMMHGFHGRVDKDDEALEMINEFCKDVSSGLHQCHEDCDEGIEMLKELYDSIKSDNGQDYQRIKDKLNEIIKKLGNLKENMICQCNFQSGLHPFQKTSKDKMHEEKETSPMANIMTPVHIAHTMPQTCLKRLPNIFQSKKHQKEAIEKVWEVIQNGLRFRPNARQTALEVSNNLKLLIKHYNDPEVNY